MGATASKPSEVSSSSKAEQRGCGSWSAWSNRDGEHKSPSSSAAKKTETQTEMLIRLKEIPENEGVWYLAFEQLAGDAKSTLSIESTTTAVSNVPIGEEKVRLPTNDEARQTINQIVEPGTLSITAKVWVKIFLVITKDWPQQRVEISAKAASKKINPFDAVKAVEEIYAKPEVKAEVKDSKVAPTAEKIGQQSIAPTDDAPTAVIIAASPPVIPAATTSSSSEPTSSNKDPLTAVITPAAIEPEPTPATPASVRSLPAFSPVASYGAAAVSASTTPATEPEPEPTPAPAPATATAATTTEEAPVSPTAESASTSEVSITPNEAPVTSITVPESPQPLSPAIGDSVGTSGASTPEPETPTGESKKAGKKGKSGAKTPTPPTQPPPPVKQQGSQKNLTATTPKAKAETPKAAAKAETPKGSKAKKGRK